MPAANTNVHRRLSTINVTQQCVAVRPTTVNEFGEIERTRWRESVVSTRTTGNAAPETGNNDVNDAGPASARSRGITTEAS